jgi:hypothetical protein
MMTMNLDVPIIAPLRPLDQLSAPPSRLPTPIDRSKILVVAKRTRIERDIELSGLSFEDVVKRYEDAGENTKDILESHAEQLHNNALVKKLLSPAQVRYREAFSDQELNNASLVITLGGDNHFQDISHRITGETPILGVANDHRSYGALLSCRCEYLEEFLTKLERGEYKISAWPTIEVEVGGKKLPPATCDVLVSEARRAEMSRHRLTINDSVGHPLYNSGGRGVSQKSSGLLIAVGAGSNNRAWARAASRFVFPNGLSFPKTARRAAFVLTEASNTHPGIDEDSNELPPLTTGDLIDGEEMLITSLNDSEGEVMVDSSKRLPFPRGTKAIIRLAKKVLWVVSPE